MNSKLITAALALGCICALSNLDANAQGTATSPLTQHVEDPSTNIVWIGGPNDTINGPLPYPIDLDANGGPWTKQIFSSATMGSGGDVLFRETIINVGTETWTDWHETNLNVGSHGAAWGINSVTGLRVNGVPITFSTTVSGSTLNLDNFSTPVLPGGVLEIDKQFAVTTDNFSPPNTLLYTLAEFPTTNIPEPTSALLFLSLAAIGAWRHRRELH